MGNSYFPCENKGNSIMNIRSALRGAFSVRSQQDIERAYLEQSSSRTDLERRQREIEQGLLRPKRFGL